MATPKKAWWGELTLSCPPPITRGQSRVPISGPRRGGESKGTHWKETAFREELGKTPDREDFQESQ
jgi:hypothetical protein